MTSSSGERTRSRRGDVLRWTLVAALLAAAWVVGSGGSDPAPRGSDGTVTRAGTIGADELRVGDCFTPPSRPGEFFRVTVVPCALPHENEVFHAFTTRLTSYPTSQELRREAMAICRPAFERYLGVTFEASPLALRVTSPGPTGWAEGDRIVMCSATDPSGRPLTGSVRDTGG